MVKIQRCSVGLHKNDYHKQIKCPQPNLWNLKTGHKGTRVVAKIKSEDQAGEINVRASNTAIGSPGASVEAEAEV